MLRLDAETALVTGSSRGIGRGIAIALAEAGVKRIAVHYLKNGDAAQVTADLVRQRGAEATVLQGDMGETGEIEALFDSVRDRFGALDVFVHNARPDVGAFYAPVEALTLEQWQSAIDTQARAMLVAARRAAALMNAGARIVAVTYAPGAQTGSWEPWAAMGPAKAAMESLCRYLAWSYASRGITVNMVSPGATDDSVFATLPEPVLTAIRGWAEAGWVPMGRLTTPADVGRAVGLLCAEEAGFVTGQTLHVDGGAGLALADFPRAIQAA